MTVTELLTGIKARRIIGRLNKEVKGIAYDSRAVRDKFLFVAIRGFSTDGHIYIKDAISRGASVVVAEESVGLAHTGYLEGDTTFIEVDNSREVLAILSSTFYKKPSENLPLVGITGTNGKTTTSYITKSILNAWGKKVGLLGTISYIIGNKIIPAIHTTPESLDLQRYLREMADENVQYVVLEVSSHAMSLKRIDGLTFKVAVFTNFSQDHLDFHGTMDEYFATKSRLFYYLKENGYAVLNWDDQRVRSLTQTLKCNIITCGLGEGAMLRAVDIINKTQNSRLKTQNWGLSFKVQTPKGELFISSPLVGQNNVYNILMALGIAYALGIDKEAMIRGVREISPVEGRFERVDVGQRFLCIVDYAHTEDALRRLIEEARLVTKGKVITLFGCGGDRDRSKRPRMGAVATGLSDFVIITSDNPRSEEPMQIINEIIRGIKKDNYMVLPDRTEAIEKAVRKAKDGDTVLLAGKGHEDYQEIKGVRHPFSDREVIKNAIQNLKFKIQN